MGKRGLALFINLLVSFFFLMGGVEWHRIMKLLFPGSNGYLLKNKQNALQYMLELFIVSKATSLSSSDVLLQA